MKSSLLLLTLISTTFLFGQLPQSLDEVATFSEGLAAVRKGDQWGFIDKSGNIVIDFRNDIYWNENANTTKDGIHSIKYPYFSNGLCMVKKEFNGIELFGFIDTNGELVINKEFLNVRPFEKGYTTGVLFERLFRGQNEFKLNVYEYKFLEVVMDTQGNIVHFLNRRNNIQMKKIRYKLPDIRSKILNDSLVAVKVDENWELRKLNLK